MRSGTILLYLAGIALFCMMDAVMKHLIAGNSPLMVTFWRFATGILFTLAIWWHAGRPAITRAMLRVHAVRALVISVAAFSFFWSLTRLTLAEAIDATAAVTADPKSKQVSVDTTATAIAIKTAIISAGYTIA